MTNEQVEAKAQHSLEFAARTYMGQGLSAERFAEMMEEAAKAVREGKVKPE